MFNNLRNKIFERGKYLIINEGKINFYYVSKNIDEAYLQ